MVKKTTVKKTMEKKTTENGWVGKKDKNTFFLDMMVDSSLSSF